MVRMLLVSLALSVAAAAQPSDPAKREQAKALFGEGKLLYDVQRFAEAAAKFEEAYLLFPDPAMLYNLARAHQFAGHREKAIRFYESYLGNYPQAEDRGDVERIVAELRRPDVGDAGRRAGPEADHAVDPGGHHPGGGARRCARLGHDHGYAPALTRSPQIPMIPVTF